MRKYLDVVIPRLCEDGDDQQHGSSVMADIAVLQALSRRVHYGKFVAESKYRSDPDGYQRLVDRGDDKGVMALLTNEAVEKKVCRRARLKAATYGREPLLSSLPDDAGPGGTSAVDADTSLIAAAAASAVVAAVEAVQGMRDREILDAHIGTGEGGVGQERGERKMWSVKGKVCPFAIEEIYRDLFIPLTKDIEVAYLFRRCGRMPPPQYAPDRMSTDPVE